MADNKKVTSHWCISFSGHFTSGDDLNLVLAKVNHLEILSVTPEGLRPIKQFTINGQVQVMKFFRPKGADKDRLFVVTARHLAMILETSGDGPTLEVVTKAYGNVGDRIGKRSETGTLAIIDPDSKVIALRIYDALLKVSSVDTLTSGSFLDKKLKLKPRKPDIFV